MKQIKEPKLVELLINIKYFERDGNLIQRFEFSVSNKKYLDFLFDKKYLFKNKINKLVREFLLDGFLSRIDDREYIEMVYELQASPKPCIRKISVYCPPYSGCKFCVHAEEKGLFIFCKEKNKNYSKPGIQRCPIFITKEDIIT